MLTCKQVTELVTDYLEGRMSFRQRVSFHLHLGMCHRCRAYLRQMKMTVRALGKLPDEPMPPDLRDELLARFRAMRPAIQAAATPRPTPLAVLDAWLGASRGWMVVAFALAVATVLALLTGGQTSPFWGTWERCLLTELGAAVLPVIAVGFTAMRARVRMSAGSLAALAAGGAFVGYLWLHLACPYSRVFPHVLVVHVGAVALSALLGAAASRLPALRQRS